MLVHVFAPASVKENINLTLKVKKSASKTQIISEETLCLASSGCGMSHLPVSSVQPDTLEFHFCPFCCIITS